MRLRIFVEPQQGAHYSTLLAAARVAEELGFDAFFRSDHYLRMGDASGLPGPTDAWLTLAGLARETSRIRLGTLMTAATFRLPGPLAISVAQVDEMSGGRIELGIGAGWYEAEHAAYGISFPDLPERFERYEEQLAIITGLWDTPVGEMFNFAGKHYTLTDSPALPKPLQQPRVPIIIGGTGPKRTPRLAATYATEYNVAFESIEDIAAAFGRLRDACAAIGRDPSSMTFSSAQVACCGRTDAELARRAAAAGSTVDDLRTSALAGSPAEIAERLEQYAAIGVQTMYLQTMDLADLDHLELLTELLPSS